MDQLETRKLAGIDIGKRSIQFSIYDEGQREMTEESFPLRGEEQREYIQNGMDRLLKHMEINRLKWTDFHAVGFTLEDTSGECRNLLYDILDASFKKTHKVNIITRFRAFAEYVFHQERAVWDRNAMLLDFSKKGLRYVLIEQIRRAKQKAYRAVQGEIDLSSYDLSNMEGFDQDFGRMMKKFLVKNPAHIIYLTGEGFEGNWMKRTLTYLCAGRRVFLGQNIYANGACLMGAGAVPFMDDGMLLMDGPDMVYHTIGVITQAAGRVRYMPITSIGREWYNTEGSLDIIMDRSQKVEFFYHNTKENEIECSVCEIKDLPDRPPKTTRLHIEVKFSSVAEGVVLLTDLGFGSMYPATGKVTIFPFKLIS